MKKLALLVLTTVFLVALACSAPALAAAAAPEPTIDFSTYVPEPEPITRGRVARSILWNSRVRERVTDDPIYQGITTESELPFSDLDCKIEPNPMDMGSLYYWAEKVGIIYGTGDGKFEPDRIVTREEWAALWMRYMIIVEGTDFGKEPNSAELDALLGDADVADWARIHYYNAVRYGFMTEVGDPKGPAYLHDFSPMLSAQFNYEQAVAARRQAEAEITDIES